MLLCLTANHRNASFEILEKLSFGAPGAAETLVSGGAVSGAVVLATCNRFEAYLDYSGEADAGAEQAIAAMSAASGIDPRELSATVTVHTGEQVAHHLFAVSSGLESVVVGEEEISGQVQRALERARSAGTASRGLERLFQGAAHTSRGVKTQTSIIGSGRSLVRLAIELVSSRVTDWAATPVLVIGTGTYARTTVAALRDRGATDIAVYSSIGRAPAFAAKNGVRVADDLEQAIADSVVVFTCTTRLAVLPQHIANANRRLIVDLGLPRNVDPAVGALAGVELLDLETIRLHAPLAEFEASDHAREIVGDAVARYVADQSISPAILAMREHVDELLEAEIARAVRNGDDGRTEAALRHFAGMLLHGPSTRARELARTDRGEEFVAGLDALFGITTRLAAELGDEAATA
ncbi:MAG: glutamyl-tRNA reductase [Rhodoglobus sp.]